MEIKIKNISTNGGIYMLSKKFLVAMFSGTTKAIAEDMIFTILVNTSPQNYLKGFTYVRPVLSHKIKMGILSGV